MDLKKALPEIISRVESPGVAGIAVITEASTEPEVVWTPAFIQEEPGFLAYSITKTSGHNGGGPGYRTSAFHAPDLENASVCVMCALEEDSSAEQLVSAVFDALQEGRS